MLKLSWKLEMGVLAPHCKKRQIQLRLRTNVASAWVTQWLDVLQHLVRAAGIFYAQRVISGAF